MLLSCWASCFHSSSFIVFLFPFDTLASFARFQLTGHLGCLFSWKMLMQFYGVVWLKTFLCVRSLLLIRKWFIKADECSYYNPESVQVVSRHGLMGKMDGVIGDHPLVSEIPFWILEFGLTVSALLSFRTVLKQGDSIFGCVGRNLRWAMIECPPTTWLVTKL